MTVAIDLFSRKAVGWTMKNSPRTNLVIHALLMAVLASTFEEKGVGAFGPRHSLKSPSHRLRKK